MHEHNDATNRPTRHERPACDEFECPNSDVSTIPCFRLCLSTLATSKQTRAEQTRHVFDLIHTRTPRPSRTCSMSAANLGGGLHDERRASIATCPSAKSLGWSSVATI